MILIFYPLIISAVPAPAVFRWIRANGPGPIPPGIMETLEIGGRWFYLVRFGIMGAFLAAWMKMYAIPMGAIGIPPKNWARSCELSAVALAFLVILRIVFQRLSPRTRLVLTAHGLSRGPVATWLYILVVGGITEEVWRALCLVAMQGTWNSYMSGVLLSSIAFAYANVAGLPGRVSGYLEEVVWEIILGVVLAGLFLTSGTVFVPYVSGLGFNIFNLYFIRRLLAHMAV